MRRPSPVQRIARTMQLLLAAAVAFFSGCRSVPRGEYMALEFDKTKPLRYRFVSSREVQIELTSGPSGKKEDSKASNESIEMVFQIRPVEIDPYGLSTLEFTCESVQVKRTTFSGKPAAADAVQALQGRSYTIQVSPTGRLELTDSFKNLLREIGQKSFAAKSGSQQQNVKDPDMILDWLFFQYTLWDLPASHPRPLEGIRVGSTWESEQFLPWPVPIQNLPSRTLTYTVEQIEEQQDCRLAFISTSYKLRERPVLNFPLPYEGNYQIRGSLFSVLRNFQHQSLEGSGRLVFNLTNGCLESAQDEYTLVTSASFILPLGESLPKLTVHQHIQIERLSDDTRSERKNGGL